MLEPQALIELSNLIIDKDPVLADKIVKIHTSVSLQIVTQIEAEGLIALAKELVRNILFPLPEIEATPKVIIPITFNDFAFLETELDVVIKHNNYTDKYDVFNSKGEHKLEFELNSDKNDIENQLKVL